MVSQNLGWRYLWAFLTVTACALMGVVALNYFADPFRVFGVGRHSGFNDRTPNTAGFDRMAKPYEVLRVQPRTVLFGSSTAHSGFLQTGGWDTPLPRPFYNYALLGSNAHEVHLSLKQTLRECPVETIIMVVDFYAYNVHFADNERFQEKRLVAATRRGWPGFLGPDLAAFALGNDALGMSWKTIVDSRRAKKGDAPAPSWKNHPWLAIFRDMEQSYLDRWFPAPARRYEFAKGDGANRIADFESSLRLSSERGVRLFVLCPPIHARFQEAIATAGAWEHYEQWKRELAKRVQVQQSQSSGRGSVAIWDFSLFNELTCESLPEDGVSAMQYWIDSAHFSPELGRLLLDEMLETQRPGVPTLGVRLDRVNVEDHLARVRMELNAFRAAHPDVVADVRAAMGGKSPWPSVAQAPLSH